jgi:NAD(P)-dependent dehydrogenase (short-subunit alcohol dehydrogenase family)
LLANLLVARLAANAPARIVVVASGVHDPQRHTGMPKPAIADLATLAKTGGPKDGAFDGRLAYVNSKLCNLWFAYELVRRIDAAGLGREGRAITVNAFDPGLVPGSGLARDYPRALRFAWERVLPGIAQALTPFVAGISTREKSGAALARLVLDPALESVSGKYFPSHTRWSEAPSSDASYDASAARALWAKSVELVHLAPGASPLAPA